VTARPKPAHYRGNYNTNATQVKLAANSTPRTVCWRDGLTLDQHPAHHNGNRPTWTAGHTIDGHPNSPPWLNPTLRPPPGPWLAPEASTCNYTNGAHRTNRFRTNPHSKPPYA